ncbi:MAG: hypothetical protein CL776_06210, partial [Chloroflexi bacterium]|nr:hypothetical protein [Chloroflexota bacterium]
QALKRLSEFQIAVSSNNFKSNPAPEVCRWCDYKSVCKKFLETATSEEEWKMRGSRVFVIGRLESLDENLGFAWVDYTGGNYSSGYFKVVDIPENVMLAMKNHIGREFSFSNLEPQYGGSSFRYNWDSTSWLW